MVLVTAVVNFVSFTASYILSECNTGLSILSGFHRLYLEKSQADFLEWIADHALRRGLSFVTAPRVTASKMSRHSSYLRDLASLVVTCQSIVSA